MTSPEAGCSADARFPRREPRCPTPAARRRSPTSRRWSFSDHGPWVLDPDHIPWQWEIDRVRRGTRREIPQLLSHRHLPPLGRTARTLDHHRRRAGRLAAVRVAPPVVAAGHLAPPPQGVRAPRLQLREARPDRLRRRGPLPRRARRRVQAPARPGAARAVRRGARGHRGGARRLARAALRLVRPHAHRRGVDRPGARGAPAHRRAGRGEGAAAPRRAALPRRHRRARPGSRPTSWAASPSPRSPTRPRWWSCSRRRSSRSSTSASRRRTCSTSRRCSPTTNQRSIIVPRPHPTLVSRRVLVMERLSGFAFDDVESMRNAGIDTHALLQAGLIASLEGAMIYGVFHGDLHGGNLVVQPDGTHRAVRLRHDRAPHRVPARRVHAPADVRHHRRPARAARRAARPRRVPARRRPRPARHRPADRRSGEGPHADVGRRPHGRDARRHQEAARARRPRAQGTDAVREEHDVPEQRHRGARAGSRHDPADDGDLHVLRLHARRPHPARGRHRRVAGRARHRGDEGRVPRRLRRRLAHLPRAAGARATRCGRSWRSAASAVAERAEAGSGRAAPCPSCRRCRR